MEMINARLVVSVNRVAGSSYRKAVLFHFPEEPQYVRSPPSFWNVYKRCLWPWEVVFSNPKTSNHSKNQCRKFYLSASAFYLTWRNPKLTLTWLSMLLFGHHLLNVLSSYSSFWLNKIQKKTQLTLKHRNGSIYSLFQNIHRQFYFIFSLTVKKQGKESLRQLSPLNGFVNPLPVSFQTTVLYILLSCGPFFWLSSLYIVRKKTHFWDYLTVFHLYNQYLS